MTTKLEQAARKYEYACRAYMFSETDSQKATANLLIESASTSLREALAEQAEQEPVAEVVLRNQTVGFGRTEKRKDIVFLADVEVGTKLYAAPVRQHSKHYWLHEINNALADGYERGYAAGKNADTVKQEPVAEAIAAEARLHRAVRAVASQAGESAEDTIEWLCNGGMAQLFECHFSGKNRESLCEDEGCPHRGVPHICIEKQAEQDIIPSWEEYCECEGIPCEPVKPVDLTDDEIYEVCKYVPFVVIGPDYDLAIARAVIAADREKNKPNNS